MATLPTPGGDIGTWGTELNEYLSVGHEADGTHKGVYNVLDHGAIGNGATDDTVAIQAAINACGAAGGGIVYMPRGTYRLATAGTSLSALYVRYDNVTLQWADDARWVNELTSQGPLFVSGTMKGGFQASWWERQMAITTNIPIVAATAGAASVTAVNSAHVTAIGLVAGDWVLIRTGATNGTDHKTPDSEINQVASVSGTTITLRYPLIKSYAQEYFPTTNSPTTLSANANPGATSITVTSAAGFTNGAWITIGSAGGIMQADGIDGAPVGNVIQLTGQIAAGLTIPSGSIVNRGTGFSTTGVTGAPSVMGLAKVTDRILHNFKLINPRWDNIEAAASTQYDAVEGLRMVGGDIYTQGAFSTSNNVRFVYIDDARIHHHVDNQGDYSIAFGTGSSNIKIRDPIITSEGTGGIVVSEGTFDVGIYNPTILHGPSAAGSAQTIAFQTRSGQGRIIGGFSRGSGTSYAIGIEPNCRPGVIDNLDVQGPGFIDIYVQSAGWVIRNPILSSPARAGITVAGSIMHSSGTGTPLGVVIVSPGSTYNRTDGGAGTSFYVKESGVNAATGWAAK